MPYTLQEPAVDPDTADLSGDKDSLQKCVNKSNVFLSRNSTYVNRNSTTCSEPLDESACRPLEALKMLEQYKQQTCYYYFVLHYLSGVSFLHSAQLHGAALNTHKLFEVDGLCFLR